MLQQQLNEKKDSAVLQQAQVEKQIMPHQSDEVSTTHINTHIHYGGINRKDCACQ